MENKSVITAHGKNRKNRQSDLSDFANLLQAKKPEAIVLGHVLVGTGIQYVNIPDAVKRKCQILGIDFERDVLPRLSSGDPKLWTEFGAKPNSEDAAFKTIEMMRSLPVRRKALLMNWVLILFSSSLSLLTISILRESSEKIFLVSTLTLSIQRC
jgi:hypothetical protein